jgi:anti-sigma factor RsiW
MSDALPGDHLSLDAVVAFVDGELPPGPAGRAAAHVDRCLTCAGEVAAQRQARRRVRAAGPCATPTSLLAALRAIPDATELPEAPAGLAVDADGALVAPAESGRVPGRRGLVARRGRRRPALPVVVGSGVVVGAAALAALAGPAAGMGAPTPVPAPRSTAIGPTSTDAAPAAAADLALRRPTPAPGLPGPGAP